MTMTPALPRIDPKPAEFLRPAVHNSRLLSKQGLSERLFTLWFGGFVYNQIWEDPRADAEALELDTDSRILAIASGGCNVLNYLQHAPDKIVAIDLNRHHIYLTRLKLAALGALPDHDAFFKFFGCGDDPTNIAMYHQHIRRHLDDGAKKYWDKRIKFFAKGFYNQSKLGMLLRFSHRFGKLLKVDPMELLACETIEDQRAFYEARIEPFFDKKVVRLVAKMPLVGFSLGIPPRQHAEMMADCDGKVADLYRERVRKLTCDFAIDDNYFLWQAMSRGYDREKRQGIPDYLKAEHFDTLRGHLNRVSTHVGSLTQYLEQQPADSLNRFVLLDSQDWMSPEQLTDLWTQIDRVGDTTTRVVFRTAPSRSPLEKALPAELMERFVPETERAAELFKRDRSAIYGGFHLYRRR